MPILESPRVLDKFRTPIYSQSETARNLGLPASTIRNWTHGYRRTNGVREVVGAPVVTAVHQDFPRGPSIPFIGLSEAYALAAIRKSGVSLQKIRPALDRLDAEIGIEHALASKNLYSDGAEVLFDYSKTASKAQGAGLQGLTVVRDGQRVLSDVVAGYLKKVTFGTDGYADVVPLPGFRGAEIVVDSRRSFGQPFFLHGGAKLEDVVSLFRAERDVNVVSEEMGVPRQEIERALAALLQSA